MAMDIGTLARNNRQIGIQLELWANHMLSKEQLTGCQSQVLLYILCHSDKGTSLTAIHHAYGYSKATLSQLIKQLREKGYVRAEPCQGDDRRKLLYGTEKGVRLLHFLRDANQQAMKWLHQQFTAEEIAELEFLQNKLLQSLTVLNEGIHKEVSQT